MANSGIALEVADELATTVDADGRQKASFAYVGSKAWHGLGQELTPGADIETWQGEAGMNWQIERSPLYYIGKDNAVQSVPDRWGLYRSDDDSHLGIVSNDYKIVHPRDVLEFYRDLVEEYGFELETAGCLFGGKKFWALAKTGSAARILGQDEIKPYLLLATSCDGSMATVADFTTVRVVCNNTLRMAIGPEGKKAKIKVPHCSIFDPTQVKVDLGIAGYAWENFLTSAEKLAKMKIDREMAIQIVADRLKKEWVNEDGEKLSQEQMLESSHILTRIISLYDGEGLGAKAKPSKGTAWGLVNAVTQYFDHEAGNSRSTASRLFDRANFGDRSKFKTDVADAFLIEAAA